MIVQVMSAGCVIDEQSFGKDDRAAIKFASDQQDKGFRVRILDQSIIDDICESGPRMNFWEFCNENIWIIVLVLSVASGIAAQLITAFAK